MRKGLLLYNPTAGRYPVGRFVHGIIKPLRAAGWSVDIAETLSGTHATQTAHLAAQEKYDAVFAIGGDGTVGQVASGLINTETALAVLLAGTTNVWAIEQGQKPFSWFQWEALRENAKILANVELNMWTWASAMTVHFYCGQASGWMRNHPQDRAASAFLQASFGAAFFRNHGMGSHLLAWA
ncbi:MAG: hypothetical protein IPO22_04030 [Anaerolineales bacterium]|nr:hypothetical protein [Anaerolineales bacterium]